MKLNDIGMLIVLSARSKAYLQALVNNDFYPTYVIIMDEGSNNISPGQTALDGIKKNDKSVTNKVQNNPYKNYFDLNESIFDTLEKNNISYEVCQTKDVNSNLIINKLKARDEKYFIYSGIGGAILRKEILNIGKYFIHVHPGIVPSFKGSTTIYYSILENDNCGASSFFMNENIDTGPLIKMKEFIKPDDGKLVDYVYDPYLRASLLLDVIKDYIKNGKFEFIKKLEKTKDETYFIIHPVLKHIAILSCDKKEL